MIKPQYELSAQYNLAKLYPIYRDSILEELEEESIINSHILSNAKIDIEGMDMKIEVMDNYLFKERLEFIKKFLERMFRERFDYHINVIFEYIEIKRKKKQIVPQIQSNKQVSQESSNNIDKDSSKNKDNNDRSNKTPRRVSKDPSVIYGRTLKENPSQ